MKLESCEMSNANELTGMKSGLGLVTSTCVSLGLVPKAAQG